MKVMNPRRRAVALVAIATAVLTGFSVSPASAGTASKKLTTAQQLSYCNPLAPEGAELFSALHASQPGVLGRGGELREPALDRTSSDLPASAKGKAKKGFSATVPVWFHVVTDGVTGSISNALIRDQMRVLNLAFGGFYGGANTGFKFELAGVTRTDNAAWFYAGPSSNATRDMKKALHRGGNDTLNLYSTTAGPYLGWAYLPDIVTKPGQAYLDGIVVDWASMPGASDQYAGAYDLGHTATHEAGHWLNLEHTFFGGCNNFGDFVADTPPELTPTSGCPGGKDTCSDPGLDPIHNYMDYSYNACYFEFTPDQAQRQADSWLLYRAP